MHRTKNTLQHPITRQPLTVLEGHRVDHIPHPAYLREPIVQLPQRGRRTGLRAHLEELNANLPSGRVHTVEFARGADDGRFDVIGRHAVGDDDDIDGFDLLRPFRLALAEIRAEEPIEPHARRGASAGADGVEDLLDGLLGGDVFEFDVVGLVEEVNVDAVAVEGGADRGDGGDGGGGFAPGLAGHGTGIVDEEFGVEGGEEGEGGVRVGGHVTGDYGVVVGRGVSGGCVTGGRRHGGWWSVVCRWCVAEWVRFGGGHGAG